MTGFVYVLPVALSGSGYPWKPTSLFKAYIQYHRHKCQATINHETSRLTFKNETL